MLGWHKLINSNALKNNIYDLKRNVRKKLRDKSKWVQDQKRSKRKISNNARK